MKQVRKKSRFRKLSDDNYSDLQKYSSIIINAIGAEKVCAVDAIGADVANYVTQGIMTESNCGGLTSDDYDAIWENTVDSLNESSPMSDSKVYKTNKKSVKRIKDGFQGSYKLDAIVNGVNSRITVEVKSTDVDNRYEVDVNGNKFTVNVVTLAELKSQVDEYLEKNIEATGVQPLNYIVSYDK